MENSLSKEEALISGSPIYYDYTLCNEGHVCGKFTVSDKCVDCCRENNRRQIEDREHVRKKRKRSTDRKEKRLGNQKYRLYVSNAGRISTHYLRRSKYSEIGMDHGETFTHEDILELYEKQNGECIGCFISFENEPFEIDHIVPLEHFGNNTVENIQLLCNVCNCSKSSRDNKAWLSELRYNQVMDFLKELDEEYNLVN